MRDPEIAQPGVPDGPRNVSSGKNQDPRRLEIREGRPAPGETSVRTKGTQGPHPAYGLVVITWSRHPRIKVVFGDGLDGKAVMEEIQQTSSTHVAGRGVFPIPKRERLRQSGSRNRFRAAPRKPLGSSPGG